MTLDGRPNAKDNIPFNEQHRPEGDGVKKIFRYGGGSWQTGQNELIMNMEMLEFNGTTTRIIQDYRTNIKVQDRKNYIYGEEHDKDQHLYQRRTERIMTH